jgi:CheY-like chemotaxis protein/anti-sigma regulatory factor (Ser/Thr protein kinase)
VTTIVRDLATYARDPAAEPEGPVDVVAVVERALKMIDHDLRHRALLVRRYPDAPVIVDGVAGRLEQVLVNILVNAIHAIEGNDPSKDQITVAIDVAREVTIAITDTGAGTGERERVFDPFFTTKAIGEGSGLGLSVCKQIVESMRGHIELESVVGRGTKVSIVFPLRDSQPPKPAMLAEDARGTRLRILVIDDEPLVRRTMKALLADEHDVEDAGDGESALAMIRDGRYDVILCDLMMPGVTGRDVYERVRAQWPRLAGRMVFVTGGAFIPTLASFLESVDNLKLRKPFTSEEALAIVQHAHQRS